MENELIINGKDAWKHYRIRMGNGFLDTLEADADDKEYITNTVRTENGTRVIPIRPLKSERNITLEFVIVGSNHNDYNERLAAFNKLLSNGFVTLQVPKSKDDIYRLFCCRKSPSYSRGKSGLIGKKSVKFIEFNPTERGALTDTDLDNFNLKDIEEYK